MGLESIGELAACMADLDIHPATQITTKVEAKFVDHKRRVYGTIEVIFNSNWHSGDGPFVEFDETIRGFGIPHLQFKPKWLDMSYDRELKQLLIASKDYEFALEFPAPRS